ncbi:hypothetical protein AB0M43_06165 [Longispora sp. NPDC051575]|uniref:hypothetical protein n=1 Tax=Longispora sp. NPDC051575 TaxID=3154943 RepID=UPI00343208A3
MGRDELTEALRSGPFHRALRAGIEARGLGLQRIRARLAECGLHVSLATLSYWQQGTRRPERRESLSAVTALEQILGLSPAALTMLLGPPRPRGPRPGRPATVQRYSELFAPARTLDRMLGELETSAVGRVHTVSLFEDVHVEADHAAVRRRSLQVVRAHEEVDRFVTIFQGDDGCDTDLVQVVPLGNCRVGRVRRDRSAGMVVTELLFDRVLRVDETHILEFEHRDGSGVPCGQFQHSARYAGARVAIQVRFAPGAVPVRCFRYTQDRPDGPDRERAELALAGRDSVHVLATHVRPGIVGVRWDWE